MAEPLPVDRPVSAAAPALRFRVFFEYALRGDLRFLSHHDELRLLTRAMVRAGWPLRYSQGFNPIPRLSIPLPRSVGLASECQAALVDLSEARSPAELTAALTPALPGNCVLRRLIAPVPLGAPHACAADYEVALDPGQGPEVSPRAAQFLAADEWRVERPGQRGAAVQQVEIRRCVETLAFNDPVLHMRLRYVDQRSARPTEILAALGLAIAAYAHRVTRTRVIWDMELAAGGQIPAVPEGKQLGTTEESTYV